MNKQNIGLLITILLALILSASCGQDNNESLPIQAITKEATQEAAEPTQTPPPAEPVSEPEPEPEIADPNPKTVLISHILAGVQGNNNYDYVALLNNTGNEVDLKGYTLSYQPRPDDELQTLMTWNETTPFISGHYLLGREGEEFAQPLDATFNQQIFNRGSLVLTDGDHRIVDLVGWGDMPAGSYMGSPAPKLPRGMTMVRQTTPPFASGSTANADLFIAEADPAVPGCSAENALVQTFTESIISPGAAFTLDVFITDLTAVESASILIPAGFGLAGSDPFIEATYVELEKPLSESQSIELAAPVTLQSVILRGGKAVINGQATCVPAQSFAVEGVVPIGLARTFIDQMVTVEGIATMYTDGFFAGSSGTKFYIADDTGGVQIFVPGGKGGVRISIGDRVRVTGKTELYRSALEVIPADFATQIEVLEKAAKSAKSIEELEAISVDLLAAGSDESLVGQLVLAEGTIGRLQEFNFSYEIDLEDEDGNKVLVYIDKLTEMSVQQFDVGQEVKIAGIFESWDGVLRLNPRVQADLARIWPEELLVQVRAPAAVSVGPIDYEIEVTNHTTEVQTNLLVTASRPEGAVETVIIDTGVTATREIINWLIPKLDPGQSVILNMSVNLIASGNENSHPTDRIFFFPVTVTSDQSIGALESADLTVYTGGLLPIWAIQGSGTKSAYVGRMATTAGIVTGIFPNLDGFFIQSQSNDQNISTSNGLFVHITDGEIPEAVASGMLINVTGKISEQSGQTEIQVTLADSESNAITIISTIDLLETIEPVQLIPPVQDGMLAYFEAREGMLVTLDGYAVSIGPVNRFGEFPLYPISLSENLDSTAPLIYREADNMMSDGIIFVDDGSDAEYASGDELPLPIVTGDIISNVTGPLAFTFGNYKIEPLNTADIIVEPSTYAERTVAEPEPRPLSQIAIASFNVENFFDPFDPHPSSPPLPSLDQYRQKLAKLSAGFKLMGYPEIVGLQEVENLKVLEDLAEQITADGGPTYQAHLLEGSDSRGIDVAYMTTNRVTLIGLEQRPAPEGITSREPLAMLALVEMAGDDQEIVLINNHFTSLAGGEEASLPRRTAQAEWNAGLVAETLEVFQGAHVVVLGDLNSFRGTPPLDALEVQLNHIFEKTGEKIGETNVPYAPYTYIFEGVAQSLDHILVSDLLFDALIEVIALPINADYPLSVAEDTGPYRSSDHNPLIAIFEFKEK
ncbi:MAG: putative extracellular nuclease [Cellvibrionaceae bacterium]|jgi:predicted extracellular nuclease